MACVRVLVSPTPRRCGAEATHLQVTKTDEGDHTAELCEEHAKDHLSDPLDALSIYPINKAS